MINFQKLFDKYRISWKNTGPNCSPNNTNVNCPFCTDDPSFHMSISNIGEWYCFRNPKHAGLNVAILLKALKIPSFEYADLKIEVSEREYKEDERDYSAWNHFTPAYESEEAINYLRFRLFQQPVEVAKQFNLKVAKEGRWAGRLLLPLTHGWTGRSMRNHLTLRYDAFCSEESYYFYSHNSSSAILVEGGLDAIRGASVSSQFDYYAKCRMALSPAIPRMLREKKYQSIFVIPDSNVLFSQKYEETKLIRSYCTQAEVTNIRKLPDDKKDLCELTESQTRRFLGGLHVGAICSA
jgi:hypothetical protein